ncbi:MAG: cell division protein FtsA, partial [Fretibacterium sp.]|nr:cell division protein FtsA [Fretibacterium sp.]
MQRESDTLVGLNVGTTKITVIVAGRDPRFRDPVKVIGIGSTPSRGISKGVIVNLGDATECVISALKDAEHIVGRRLDSAVVAFNSLDVESIMTHGMVSLGGREPSRVTVSDLERVIETAQSRLTLSNNTLSVHTIPVHYTLDERPVEEPLNMTGAILEMTLQTVSVPKTNAQNVITCVEDAGLHVEGLVLKPLAAALGALTSEEMRVGAISLSIGGGATGLVLYSAGRPFKIMSVPIGGEHVTTDLARVLRIPLRRAEMLKRRLFSEDDEVLRQEGIDVKLALEVVASRLEELFLDHVQKPLREFDLQMFPSGVVLSGGVAKTPGISDMLSEILQLPVRVAVPGDLFSPMPPGRDDTGYVSATGLLRYMLYRQRHSHLFIEPTYTELRTGERSSLMRERETVRISETERWNFKNLLDTVKERLRD